MLWLISFFLGIIIILLMGFLIISSTNLKEDVLLFSFSIGVLFITFLLFSINQYFRIPLSPISVWAFSLLTLFFLFVIQFKRIKKIKLKLKYKFSIFSILILIIFLLSFYKAIFFPITSGDAVSMYAFVSEKAWIDGFPPQPSSSLMEVSYAYPNTNFALFLYNYFFGINLGFNDIFIKILVPLFSILNLIIIYRISYILFKKKEISELSVALVLSSIVFSGFIIQEYTTMYELFFPLLAVYSFSIYYRENNYKFLILTGIFLSATLMIKYTLIPFVIFFLLSILLIKKNIKVPLKLGLIAFPLSSIFYLRNLIFFKNPFYPYFFGGVNFNPYLSHIHLSWAAAPKYTLEQLFIALIPISLFIWIFFLLFLINVKKLSNLENKELIKILSLTSILFFLFWFFTSAFITEASGFRHLVPAFSIASIFSSYYLVNRIKHKNLNYFEIALPFLLTLIIYFFYFNLTYDPFFEYSGNLLLVIFLSSLLISLALLTIKFNIPTKIVLTLLLISLMITPLAFSAFAKRTTLWEFPSKEEVIKKYYPNQLEVFSFINNNLPKNSTILTFYNQRYYIKRYILPADSPKVFFIYKNISLESAIKKLKELGVNYIMISKQERHVPFWNLSVIHKAYDKGNLNLEVVYENKEVTLYKI